MRDDRLKVTVWVLLAWWGPVGLVAAAERVALVIGNDAYRYGGALHPAVSDARTVGDTLQTLGFQVLRRQNLDYSGLLDALDEIGPWAEQPRERTGWYAMWATGFRRRVKTT
ncbi:MAG TPA: caspase family protein [Candidatus Competibacter sp.]|nr:caspase family protein [Candidatus Competibacter sp.]HRX62890.1 caspase family protein [Candidatus Competibacter sp.]